MTTSSSFKDLFSKQSTDYANFRPTYPPKLFDFLATEAPDKLCAWDCGTGNGQAALMLAERFENVIATDPSEKQLQNAVKHAKIQYFTATAEQSGLKNSCVSLITVAQAFHWFHQDVFFTEVKRILKPGGVIALWCYELATISPEVDAVVLEIYNDVLGHYWEKERKLVESGYRDVMFPFQEMIPPRFPMQSSWSLAHLIGYLNTWSATQNYIKKNGSNPIEPFEKKLAAAWGSIERRDVFWPLSMRIGRRF